MNGVRLYFDVEGCGLAALDTQMIARPTLVFRQAPAQAFALLNAFLPESPRQPGG